MGKKAIYYDTETTGVKAGKDRIIEIAAFDPEESRSFSMLTHPECSIPDEVTRLTSITDEMVKDAPKIRDVLLSFVEFCREDSILVAHNNDAFDQLFLEAEFKRASLEMPKWTFFDTLKWSRKYRNDLPKHNLQYLRESFGIASNQAHRALDDVFVLHKIFSQMIDDLPWETVLELAGERPKIIRMPFGKHAGKPLSEVPSDYLRWLQESGALEKKENAFLKESILAIGGKA